MVYFSDNYQSVYQWSILQQKNWIVSGQINAWIHSEDNNTEGRLYLRNYFEWQQVCWPWIPTVKSTAVAENVGPVLHCIIKQIYPKLSRYPPLVGRLTERLPDPVTRWDYQFRIQRFRALRPRKRFDYSFFLLSSTSHGYVINLWRKHSWKGTEMVDYSRKQRVARPVWRR